MANITDIAELGLIAIIGYGAYRLFSGLKNPIENVTKTVTNTVTNVTKTVTEPVKEGADKVEALIKGKTETYPYGVQWFWETNKVTEGQKKTAQQLIKGAPNPLYANLIKWENTEAGQKWAKTKSFEELARINNQAVFQGKQIVLNPYKLASFLSTGVFKE